MFARNRPTCSHTAPCEVKAGPTPASSAATAISRTMAGAFSGTTTGVLLVRNSGCRSEYACSCSHAESAAARHSSEYSSGAVIRSSRSCTCSSKDPTFFLISGIRTPGKRARRGYRQTGGDLGNRPAPRLRLACLALRVRLVEDQGRAELEACHVLEL